MKINDPVRLNDWKIKDFLLAIAAVQTIVLASIGLDVLGLNGLFLRQIIGVIYLLFVPGIILLRVLKVHNLSIVETLLYAVGLSIAFVMLLGLTINVLFPVAGIPRPLAAGPLVLTVSLVVMGLCALSYLRDRDFSSPHFLDTRGMLSPVTIALCLLPLLSVVGAYLMNLKSNNEVLLVLLVIVSIMPILAMFDRFPKELFALTVFVIAFTLLLHYSLITTYLTGWDINVEYFFANAVKQNSYWISSLSNDYNAMLSIVMLAPILSNVCNISIVWIFKVVYPFLFSFVPLGLYVIFEKQTNKKTAFLSSFLFMAIFTFYSEMLALARQEIAEVFEVLIILVLIEGNLSRAAKSILSILFVFSLITSHYSISYLFAFSAIFIWVVLTFVRKQGNEKSVLASHTFVFLCLVLGLGWYVYVSSSSVYLHIVQIGNHIASNLFQLLNPRAVEGLNIIVSQSTTRLHQITKYLYLFIDFLISVGIVALILRRTNTKFKLEYKLFSLASFGILVAGITVPYFAGALNTSRIFQIALIFLAPFFVVGAKVAIDTLTKIVKRPWKNEKLFFKMIAVFLTVFFLFDSGLLYQVARSSPTSIALNASIDFPRFNEEEVNGAQWLVREGNTTAPMFSDLYRNVLLSGLTVQHAIFFGGGGALIPLVNKTYFFLGTNNVKNGELVFVSPDGSTSYSQQLQNLTFYNETLLRSDKIYDSGGAQAYYYQYYQIIRFR